MKTQSGLSYESPDPLQSIKLESNSYLLIKICLQFQEIDIEWDFQTAVLSKHV